MNARVRKEVRRTWPAVFLPIVWLGACLDDPTLETAPPFPGQSNATTPATSVQGAAVGTTYRRTFAFMDVSTDSSLFVPWDFVNRVEADGIARAIRGWLGRSGEWRMFVEEDWSTEPVRAPWRIVPHGSARMLVGMGGAVQELYFRDAVRDVAVRPGGVVAEWNERPGETYRLLTGTAVLGGAETEGLLLDAFTARATETDDLTEIALLAASDGYRMIIANSAETDRHRAWARRHCETWSWPDVELAWQETRTFERARREVPVTWQLEARDPGIAGEFEAVSSHQHSMPGSDTLRSAMGVYEIGGFVEMEAERGTERVDLKGFLLHFQR